MSIKIITDEYNAIVRCFEKTSAAGNAYKDYAISLETKNVDETWNNALFNVRFKKDVVVPDKTKIKINNCFPVVNMYNGKPYVNWIITDFEVVELPAGATNDGFMDIPDGLPEEVGWD